jgi:hypothetical protein
VATKPYDLLSYQEQIEALASIQDCAIKYRALASSGEYDADTSKLLMELADMVEAKAKKFLAAGK